LIVMGAYPIKATRQSERHSGAFGKKRMIIGFIDVLVGKTIGKFLLIDVSVYRAAVSSTSLEENSIFINFRMIYF
jgi:hypothetical protein